MNPPKMAPWNLGLRFLLELAALVGVGALAWQAGGIIGWIGVVVAPIAGGALWATFNVVEDPSRSGHAPVEVPGWIRLTLELVLFGGGAIGIGAAWGRTAGIVVGALMVFHYLVSYRRVGWLVRQ